MHAYPKIRNSILGKEMKGKNNVRITEDDITGIYKVGNVKRVTSTLTKLASAEYVCIINGEISAAYNIKDELIDFINSGCEYTQRKRHGA